MNTDKQFTIDPIMFAHFMSFLVARFNVEYDKYTVRDVMEMIENMVLVTPDQMSKGMAEKVMKMIAHMKNKERVYAIKEYRDLIPNMGLRQAVEDITAAMYNKVIDPEKAFEEINSN